MPPSLFDPGLRSVAVAETTLSDLREDGSLIVGGYRIEELAAEASYEEVVFLLLEDRLPTPEELDAFRTDLARRRTLGDALRSVLERAAAADAPPMRVLQMGATAATMDVDASDPHEQSRRMVAVFPTIVATYWRYRQGKAPVEPRRDLGHAANYLYMLRGEEPTAAERTGIETFLTTLVEHGLNASTFAARVASSTRSDPICAGAAAVGTLGGRRHGGRLEFIFQMLREAHAAEDCEAYVRERLTSEDTLLGFGHRMYEVRDPRAAVLGAASERFCEASGDDAFLATVREFESVAQSVLSEQRPDRRTEPTVEFHAASLLDAVGVPSSLFVPTFAVSRVGGWMAHCLEQLDADDLLRPEARYVGETDRTWLPVEDRHVAGGSIIGHPPRSDSLEPVSQTLTALSESNRLEILLTLYDIDGPADYSALRAATSIDDKGKLNYHLRRLREYFVDKSADGYSLTEAGETVVEMVVNDDALLAVGQSTGERASGDE